jgi:GT2 family glycosyltransferase
LQNLQDQFCFIHVVILGYGHFKDTTQLCLSSIIPELGREDVQVTVIDNGSLDNSAQLQDDFVKPFQRINSVLLPKNLGYAGGMNYGVSLFDASWVLLLGSDTILKEGAFEILYQELKEMEQQVGIVGPVTNEAGTCQKLDFKSGLPRDIFLEFSKRYSAPTLLHVPIYRADFFCVAIRKSLWDQLGGLDLSYGKGYYEDFDFCMRAKQLNFQSIMIEDMFVFHAGSLSFKSDPTQKQLIRNNKKIFIKKFPDAELRHRREDNQRVLEWYMQLSSEQFNMHIHSRLLHRLGTAEKDQPKGLIKKWLWNQRLKKLQTALTLLFK